MPSTEEIKGLLQNKNWPSVIDIETTKKICQKNYHKTNYKNSRACKPNI